MLLAPHLVTVPFVRLLLDEIVTLIFNLHVRSSVGCLCCPKTKSKILMKFRCEKVSSRQPRQPAVYQIARGQLTFAWSPIKRMVLPFNQYLMSGWLLWSRVSPHRVTGTLVVNERFSLSSSFSFSSIQPQSRSAVVFVALAMSFALQEEQKKKTFQSCGVTYLTDLKRSTAKHSCYFDWSRVEIGGLQKNFRF